MNLHNEIMNIPCETGDPRLMSMAEEANQYQYREGHRDARHAAAELSLKYERALEDALFEFGQLSEMAQDSFVRVWAEQRIAQIKEILEE